MDTRIARAADSARKTLHCQSEDELKESCKKGYYSVESDWTATRGTPCRVRGRVKDKGSLMTSVMVIIRTDNEWLQ